MGWVSSPQEKLASRLGTLVPEGDIWEWVQNVCGIRGHSKTMLLEGCSINEILHASLLYYSLLLKPLPDFSAHTHTTHTHTHHTHTHTTHTHTTHTPHTHTPHTHTPHTHTPHTHTPHLSSQNPNTGLATRSCATMFWNTGVMWSTEMEGNAIPKIPSNLAAMNVSPGCLVASAKTWFLTCNPAIWEIVIFV